MPDIALLAYVPDPFAVRSSHFRIREPSGLTRTLNASELSAYPSRILTYDLPALVDDLRRTGRSPPQSVLDIGEAMRLAAGKSKDDGGERLWNFWSTLKNYFDNTADAASFELVVIARMDRPVDGRLSELLDAALSAFDRLWNRVKLQLKTSAELDRLISIEWPLQSLFAFRQFYGVRINPQSATDLLARISAEKYAAYREVAQILNKSPTGLNFRNIHQYLERTDVAHLSEIENGGRLQDAFEIAAPSSKFASAFITLFKSARDETIIKRALGAEDRLYPIFSVLGTITGRILASDPYLQQLRRSYRSLIIADPGNKLVYLDFAQFEPGILAGLAEDRSFLAAYNAGDLYSALAITLFDDALLRPTAKRIFLAFLYGMTTNRIATLLCGAHGTETARALYAEKIANFFEAFPGLEAFRISQQRQLAQGGFVSSLNGNRRVRTGPGPLSSRENRWAMNHPVQSTASLIFKEALLDISSEFSGAQIVLPMHDAVLMQIEDDENFEIRVERAKTLMIQTFTRRFPTVKVRVTVGSFAD